MGKPPSHTDSLKRLKRIEGQVHGIQRMVEEGRYCIDILQQITAVRRALEQTALVVMRRHIDSCVSEAIRSKHGETKISELMDTMDRFLR